MANDLERPGLTIRLIVIIYDLLLLAGVLFASYAVIFIVFLIFPEYINQLTLIKSIKFILLIGVAFLFYGWFWVNGGQTLGMKAWHLYLVDENGKFISWRASTVRFITAIASWVCFGLGFIWILFNQRKLSWHDYASNSQIVRAKPTKN